MASVSPEALENARSEVMGLMLAQLKNVARYNKLPVSGVKAVLQDRIKQRLADYARRNDTLNFKLLAAAISNPDRAPKSDEISTTNSLRDAHAAYAMGGGPISSSQPPDFGQVRPIFKDSPFYIIQSAITAVHECKVRETTRDSFECKIRLSPDTLERFAKQTPRDNLRFMIYCASEPVSRFQKVDIAFPNQIEIRINGNEVKANLRGLKNKPGSTRPADISDLIHRRPNYSNSMSVTYALTSKKFYLLVNLVNQIRPETLVEQLKARNPIRKEQVIKEMVGKAQDNEIQTTSSIMSLKCPLSTLRMNLPCRSTICTHNQCFDALSFLQLQEQAPTWVCPICSRPVAFESLHVDEYVDDILKSTPHSTDQILVEPDGKWAEVSSEDLQPRGAHSSSEEDDDLIELHEYPRVEAVRAESLLTPSFVAQTPPQSSREQSIASANPRSSTSKRPVSDVIDLTLSSDEDDQPRASKRQANHHSAPIALRTNGLSGSEVAETSNGAGVMFSMPQKPNHHIGFHPFGSGR